MHTCIRIYKSIYIYIWARPLNGGHLHYPSAWGGGVRAAFCIEGLVGGWVGWCVGGWVGGPFYCESWGLLVFKGFTILKTNCF